MRNIATMIDSIPTLAALVPKGENTFESQNVADKMGNLANIGYGGSTLAFAINAASATVEPNYRLYSALGNFLGPVLTDRKMNCTVSRLRDTRSFATREVRVSQDYPDGKSRLVLTMLADYQVPEPASVLAYSAKPSISYAPVAQTVPAAEHRQRQFEAGVIKKGEQVLFDRLFSAMGRYFEHRPCPEGVASQNLAGLAKHVKTTQDHLSLPEKTSADWYKHRKPLATQTENLCAMSYLMDGMVSFVPLTHSHRALSDAGSCSSLDFALRVFSNDVSLDKWHLRELKTVRGGNGRTYSEGRIWDEDGNMIANMTQQSILRPVAVKAAL